MNEFTQEQLKDLWQYDFDEDIFEVLEEGDWSDDGKYQFATLIFKHGGKTYATDANRSGSYHTDYYYSWEDSPLEAYEVEEVETVTKKWVAKK